MGFLDKIKKVVSKVPLPIPAMPAAAAAAPAATAADDDAPADDAAPVYDGPTFTWDGDQHPMPAGWADLTIDEWFFKFETLRDRMRYIDKEELPPMTDADGDRLDPEEALLVVHYGFKSGGHYEKYKNWAVSDWARRTGESYTDLEFRMGAIARERILAAKTAAMSGAGGALAPVEGVALEQWAQLQAKLAGGAEPTPLIAAAGIDAARWAQVSAEWNRRMSTSGVVAAAYAKAFTQTAVGPYGAAAAQATTAGYGGDPGPAPVPFELFVEVTEALRAAGKRGQDTTATLAAFNLRPIDWSNIGAYWNRAIAQQATKYHRLYDELGVKFAAKYGNGDGLTTAQREQMIFGKLIGMARSKQPAAMVPFLREYFPEDADDRIVLDGWLRNAVDQVGTSDLAAARQLLLARYPLQEDEEDPLEVWVAAELERL